METSFFSEKRVISHGCSPSSAIPNTQLAVVPSVPPRLQSGALPRMSAEPVSFQQRSGESLAQHISSQLNLPRPFSSSSSQQEASLKLPIEEQTLSQELVDVSTCPVKETGQGQFLVQHGVIPQHGGALSKRKNPAPGQNGQLHVGKFSRSWHRVSAQEPSPQRGALPRPEGPKPRPWMRGAILPSFHEQAHQAPYIHTSSFPGPSFVQPTVAMEHMVRPPFFQMKCSFSGMWLQLEGAIQNRERMLVDTKAEMEKALSEVKIMKDDALKEKKELEARKAEVRDDLGIISRQTGKLKSMREGLEQISTDLSVQVAELNHWLQQAQEQQRVLKVLESLKDHRDASNDKNSFMFENLHDCEVKLVTMEKELVTSKHTTELLEKAALKWTSDLEDLEAGCGPLNYSANSGEQETSHAAALKQPKLEVVS